MKTYTHTHNLPVKVVPVGGEFRLTITSDHDVVVTEQVPNPELRVRYITLGKSSHGKLMRTPMGMVYKVEISLPMEIASEEEFRCQLDAMFYDAERRGVCFRETL